ncbi:MAG: RHS repeat protein [Niabella sp.]
MLNYSTGGTSSSGILAGLPRYLEEDTMHLSNGQIYYWYWYDYSIEPLSLTNGNHITYSEVIEKEMDGSYSIFKYSNHDQSQYRDRNAIAGTYPIYGQWKLSPCIDMSLERGKLLEKDIYNANNILVQKINYVYDEGTEREVEAVKVVSLNSRGFQLGVDTENNPLLYIDNRTTAYLRFTFPQFLLKEIQTTYNQSGQNPLVDTVIYTYNRSFRTVTSKSIQRSTGDAYKSFYKYPFDYTISGTATHDVAKGILNLQNKYIFAQAVEQYDQITHAGVNKTIKGVFTTFKPASPLPDSIFILGSNTGISDFIPATISANTVTKNANYFLASVYKKYDEYGNAGEVQKANVASVVYLWGYKSLYPVAEITGSDYNTVNAVVSQAQLDTTTDQQQLHTLLNTLRTDNRTKTAIIKTFTYKPLVGMTSETTPAGKITYYEYDEFGRLKNIKDENGNIIKTICYNYAGQQVDCGTISVTYYNTVKSQSFTRNS